MQHYVGHEVKCLHWLIRHTMDTALESMGLTGPQSQTLQFIARQENPPCIRDVEEKFGFSHATVCGILSRLESKEFIILRPDEKDRRIRRLFLLPRGEDCLQKTCHTLEEIEAQLISGFTPQEQDLFHQFLHRSIDNLKAERCCRESKEGERK